MASQSLTDSTTRHSVYLERLKTGEANKFLPFLKQMDKSLTKSLAGDITEYSRRRLEKLVVSVRRDMAGIMGEYADQLEMSLVNVGEYEAEFESRNINELGFESVVPPLNQVRAAIFTTPLTVAGADGGKLLTPFIRGWTRQDAARISNQIRQGYFAGLTNTQIRNSIRGTVAKNFKNGTLAQVNRHATAITRTSVQHAASVARQETWRENDDIVIGYEWLSTLDSRTSTICRTLDGNKYKLDKGPLPPAHINCRSTTLAVLDERYALSRGDDENTRSARSTKTGKSVTVPNQSYYQWLKAQPKAFQASVIGPTRAKLLRDGGLSAQRFSQLQLDKTFKPLTLAEMRRLEPLAFEKAFGTAKKVVLPKFPTLKPKPPAPPPPAPAPVPKADAFVPAKTFAEAKATMLDKGYAKTVDFGKMDLRVVNEMNQSLHEHFADFPQLRNRFGYLGSTQASNRIIYDRQVEHYLDRARRMYPDASDARIVQVAKKWAKRPRSSGEWAWARPKTTAANANAVSVKVYKDLDGISFNEKFSSSKGYDSLQAGLKRSLESKWHPVATDTVKSLMDHEMGHQMDYLLDLAKDKKILDMRKAWGGDQATLSKYGTTNVQEFIAEAWAEYRNNPAPRAVAKQLGEYVEAKYAGQYP